MKIYSMKNPDYYMEFKGTEFNTDLLKAALRDAGFVNTQDEFLKYETIENLKDKLMSFGINHPYIAWVLTYVDFASKYKEDGQVVDAGFWTDRKFRKLDILESAKEEKNKELELTDISEYPTSFVSFDVESTGLNVDLSEIIQIAAVKYKDGVKIDELDTLVKPKNAPELTPQIEALTGIKNSDIQDAPIFEEAVKEFLNFIDGHILVGHNIKEFDITIINKELERAGMDTRLENQFVDTYLFAKKVRPHMKRGGYKLTSLVDTFFENDFEDLQAHNALDDSIMTGAVYLYLLEQSQKNNGF